MSNKLLITFKLTSTPAFRPSTELWINCDKLNCGGDGSRSKLVDSYILKSFLDKPPKNRPIEMLSSN